MSRAKAAAFHHVRLLSRPKIRTAFADGWRVDWIEPVMIDNAIQRGAANAWLAAITRT